MDQVTCEMASEYERIYENAASDPGTAGDEGEENWATLFREWLPPTYHVQTKGRLIGHDGRLSPQVDVLILRPSYPKKLLEKKIWLAGGVIAAFECKNTLTAAHVESAVSRCSEFKSLFHPRTGTPRAELRSPLIYGLLAHSHSWKGEKSDPLANVQRALEAASEKIDHPRNLLDLVCVADLAYWHITFITSYDASWSPAKETLERVFGGGRGPMTTHTCASLRDERQKSEFRPIGSLISSLVQDIAWTDQAVRELADYYRLAHLGGNSSGTMRAWPCSVYSSEVMSQILAGRFTNGSAWDEWAVGGS